MTNWENGVRVPLLVKVPWLHRQHKSGSGNISNTGSSSSSSSNSGSRVAAPAVVVPHVVEAVDLYRSLADLSGLGSGLVESGVDGTSFASLLVDPAATPLTARPFARSQFPRCFTAIHGTSSEHLPMLDRTDCQDVSSDLFDLMGYSIRTPEWRLTEWMQWDGQKLQVEWCIVRVCVESLCLHVLYRRGGICLRMPLNCTPTPRQIPLPVPVLVPAAQIRRILLQQRLRTLLVIQLTATPWPICGLNFVGRSVCLISIIMPHRYGRFQAPNGGLAELKGRPEGPFGPPNLEN